MIEAAKAVVPDLNEEKFKATMSVEEAGKLVDLDTILVGQFGVAQTPTIMVNDKKVATIDYTTIKAVIEQELNH